MATAFLLLQPPAFAADYTFTHSSGSHEWNAPATWGLTDPGAFPGSPDDNVLFSPASGSEEVTLLVAPNGTTSIGNLVYDGDGTESQRLYARRSRNVVLKLVSLQKGGNRTLVIGNGGDDRSLGLEIGTFELDEGTVEIGQGTALLDKFEVSGTTKIGASGLLLFTGINNGNRLRLGALDLEAGGRIYLGGRGNSTGTLEVASLQGAGEVTVWGSPTHAGTASTVEIVGDGPAPTTFTGTLRDTNNAAFPATLALIKQGEGTQILSRTGSTAADHENPYSGGTIISGGILAIHNERHDASVLGTGAVTVGEGGVLAAAGTGTVRLGNGRSITIEAGGALAPGALGEGFAELKLNGAINGSSPILLVESGGELVFRLGSGNQSDTITFLSYEGAADLPSTGMRLTLDQVQEGVFTLFSFFGDEAGLTSVGSGLAAGAFTLGPLDGFTGTLHYDETGYGGLGVVALEIVAIPEPATLSLLPGVVLLGVWQIRRRRKKGASPSLGKQVNRS